MVRIELVEDIRKRMKEDNEYIRRLMAGKVKFDKKRAEKRIIVTPEVFAKIFSPQRLRLLLKIKKNHVKNIYQLAKNLGRKYEAVHRDIAYLEGFGLIKIKSKDKKKIPYMDERITIPELAAA